MIQDNDLRITQYNNYKENKNISNEEEINNQNEVPSDIQKDENTFFSHVIKQGNKIYYRIFTLRRE